MAPSIQLHAHVFINPWDRAMPDIYVVSLQVPETDSDHLFAVCERLSTNNRWQECFQAAQTELGWGCRTLEGVTTVQFLIRADELELFKNEIRTVTTEID